MIAVLVAMLLAGQSAERPDETNTVSPAVVSPKAIDLPTDADIAQSLNGLLKTNPDKVVCLRITRIGSHLPQRDCRSIRAWYDYEAARQPGLAKILQRLGMGYGDTPGSTGLAPPYELLQYVKDRYRNPTVRAEAKARAIERARVNARRATAAEPAISNP